MLRHELLHNNFIQNKLCNLYSRHSAVEAAQSSDWTFPWLLHLKRFGTGLSLHDAGQFDQAENVSSKTIFWKLKIFRIFIFTCANNFFKFTLVDNLFLAIDTFRLHVYTRAWKYVMVTDSFYVSWSSNMNHIRWLI